ncbi:twin-arginine translocation signal domain-containing protein [Synechococcus lacustris C3-12m-Tous]|uniref:carbonic anhydrase n=1 Tax=Synechococcus lacustris TaxID=2116544 RepID=UPI0020CBA17C|nr:carbonic anhydrase [Synechococcus lacustris]MCP9923678.1 twin-arginine translocation signal domain-containing protein [Synechococcus lacustris C3-12m-Tous]
MAPSRRELLEKVAFLGAALGLGQCWPGLAQAAVVDGDLRAQLEVCKPSLKPLQQLIAGNQRFMKAWAAAGEAESPDLRMQALQLAYGDGGCEIKPQALAKGQRPWAAVLTCADSRVPLEWLFNTGDGELFGVRSAGNTAFNEGVASLEYAVANLDVPLIMVLGHSGCGAVTAAMADAMLTPLLEDLVTPIRASFVPGNNLTEAIKGNACYSAAQLPKRSELLRKAQTSGKLKIQPAYFDIESGQVSLLLV